MVKTVDNSIIVEVVYCARAQQFLKKLAVNVGSTLIEVISLSEIQKHFMEIDFSHPDLRVGVFSKIKPLNYVLKDGARIEIYRQLYQTPMQARLARARKK